MLWGFGVRGLRFGGGDEGIGQGSMAPCLAKTHGGTRLAPN